MSEAHSPAANGIHVLDRTPDHKSSRSSVDTPRTKRSHRSRSRSHERHSSSRHHREKDKDKERTHDSDRKRRSSRSRDRHSGGHSDREREKERRRRSRSPRERHEKGDGERDKERERDRDRDRFRERDRDRDRERDERRRRKRDEDELPPKDGEDRSSKRLRDDKEDPSRMDIDVPDKVPRDRSRDSERRRERERARYSEERRYRERDELDRRPPPPPDRRRIDDVPMGRASPMRRRPSPTYDLPSAVDHRPPEDDDSEARSVFVSQLAARLTARDLGYFFEDKLGENTVRDSRIVTDRLSRRSKGIAYVELSSIDLVSKAIALSGTIVMGLPIMVQLTESERNKQQPSGDSLNLPPGVTAPSPGTMQLYVGSLHFNLTENDIKQVFEPFGELEFVDLHKDPQTGRSKGYAFVQYKRSDDAKMALEQMDGFELAGRQLRVNTVHEKGTASRMTTDSLDETGGSLNNNSSRHILMQKLARTEVPAARPAAIMRPNIPQVQTRCILLKNMFDPAEETEQDWDKDLAEDVKGEAESKYGPVEALKIIKESQGEIYVKFDTIETASKAMAGLNGRWFGGKQVSAAYISDAIMQAQL